MDRKRSYEVRQLTKQVAGLGMKDSLTLFQPIMKRRKSSFFRSFDNRASLQKRVRQSLKRKVGHASSSSMCRTEWYKQTSTDIGTDSEYEDVDEDEECIS